MSSEKYGIEEARGRLGDLVTAAQQGTDIIITRNGRPAARLTRYQEDTVTYSQALAQISPLSTPVTADDVLALHRSVAQYPVLARCDRWEDPIGVVDLTTAEDNCLQILEEGPVLVRRFGRSIDQSQAQQVADEINLAFGVAA